ncbi:MAG: hypothetical protein QOF39_3535 [Frankiales bacterium]|nr:hypothetical protein [Frankiales bacterium]
MPRSRFDQLAFHELLRAQEGLFTADQARACGLSSSALSRRVASGVLRRVLPGVYAHTVLELSTPQRTRAAVLYAGNGACLTGAAALHWRRIPYLPTEVSPETVDVLVPVARTVGDSGWARLTRTSHTVAAIRVDGVATAPVVRSVVDAALRLPSYETVFALVSCVVNAGRTTVEDVKAELNRAATRGSRALRLAVEEAETGTRSWPEAEARATFCRAGLPTPLINVPLLVGDRFFVPDFRWDNVIVEIDSRAHHLLEVGSWDKTQQRRTALRAAGYVVLPFTPQEIRETPELVIATILAELERAVAS